MNIVSVIGFRRICRTLKACTPFLRGKMGSRWFRVTHAWSKCWCSGRTLGLV